jgi:hypothetical protein
MSGNFRQVLEAFEMVTELMHATYIQTIPSEHFSVQILLEHAKVCQSLLFNENKT